MSFRKHFEKLESQFNKVLDSIDKPKQSSGSGAGGAPPPVPNRPAGYNGQPQNQYQHQNQTGYGQFGQVNQGYQYPGQYQPNQPYQQQGQFQHPSPGGQYQSPPPGQYWQPQPPNQYGAQQPYQQYPSQYGQASPIDQSQQHSQYPPPTQTYGQPPPPPPPPSIPVGSKPTSTSTTPLPPNLASKPKISSPPTYTPQTQSIYWSPTFSPSSQISDFFDYDLGAGGWGNNELQTYTSYPTNSFFTPSSLVLRCIIDKTKPADRDKYTSARLLSKQRLARPRGYLSATLAAPCAKGIWPAFWLLPEEPFEWPTDGEVDIFEAWNGGRENHSCLHWGNYHDACDKSKHRVINTSIPSITDPHEYGFAWSQNEHPGKGGRFIWYIDGRPVMKAGKPVGTKRMEVWRILLNVAVGGTVCDGCVPEDGVYDLTLSRLIMCEEPPGGWGGFERDWSLAAEGRALD